MSSAESEESDGEFYSQLQDLSSPVNLNKDEQKKEAKAEAKVEKKTDLVVKKVESSESTCKKDDSTCTSQPAKRVDIIIKPPQKK